MVEIDGSQGEGGGQIFRTALTLSMCLGKPVCIRNIRAGRRNPGLLRQHLTCLRAAQSICHAHVVGDQLGSMEVMFKPGTVQAGKYQFSVGTAGSTSLVFQTVYLPLFFAEGASELYLEGGTHNGLSPSFDFIESCFMPAIVPMGYTFSAQLEGFGFYPAGGGSWKAQVLSAQESVQKLKPLQLLHRGKVHCYSAVATSAKLPHHVTERELNHIQKKLLWPSEVLEQRLINSVGPGNIVSLRVNSEHVTEVVEVVGEKGMSAERVATKAIVSITKYLNMDVPVGEYLADQLLLPMVLGKGGEFKTGTPSMHLLSNANVIKQFMHVNINIVQEDQYTWRVCVVSV